MNNNNKLMCSICCTTYNHEGFIDSTMDGFLSQKTNFNFEIVIGEDCSTDKTRQKLLEYKTKYPDKINLILHQKNIGSMQNFISTLEVCQGKYIAICEGDDCWIDPNKLQKQVEFLEANSNYGLVFTDANHLYQDKGRIVKSYDKTYKRVIPTGKVFNVLLHGNPYKTCTSLFRKEYIQEFASLSETIKRHNFKMGDKILWLVISSKSNVGYLPFTSAQYRICEQSASHFIKIDQYSKFEKSSYKTSIFFSGYFNYPINKSILKYNYKHSIITKCVERNEYMYLIKFICSLPLILKIIIKEKLIRKLIK